MATYEVELEKMPAVVMVEVDDDATEDQIEDAAIEEATRRAEIFTLKRID